MARLRQQGFEYGANKNDIIIAIHEVAGSTHDTREKYMTELRKQRFISSTGGASYDLNHESAEGDDDTSVLAELGGRMNALEARIKDLEDQSIYWTPKTLEESNARRTELEETE